jgi:hypothetical protein
MLPELLNRLVVQGLEGKVAVFHKADQVSRREEVTSRGPARITSFLEIL